MNASLAQQKRTLPEKDWRWATCFSMFTGKLLLSAIGEFLAPLHKIPHEALIARQRCFILTQLARSLCLIGAIYLE